ncbi:MAG TPA: S8 family peptidase [Microlunatus sp.]
MIINRRAGAVTAAALACVIAIAGCANGELPRADPTSSVPTATARPSPPVVTAAPSPTPEHTATPGLRPTVVVQQNPRWALDRIDQRQLPFDRRYLSQGQGEGVTVYVVDGLFDTTNAEFGGRATVGLDLGQPCVLEDGLNHGMFVAGLVGGRRTGVAKKAKIIVVGSSYGCEGSEMASPKRMIKRVVRAVDWVAENAHKPAVVNLSLNTDGDQPELVAAVDRLVDAGLTVVGSAGNGGENACGHAPAGLPSVITVTGSTKTDRDAGLNYGRCVDLYAPASGVTSVVGPEISPNRLARSDQAATSWAAPIASGVTALYLSAHPNASPQQVRSWMIENASTGVIRGDRHGTPNRLLYSR